MAALTGGNGGNGRHVTFVCREAPDAKQVYVAGDFNEWNPSGSRMCRYRDGTFRAKVSLAPGEYQYKFVVDGVWLNDSEAEVQAVNSYGTVNSVVRVD
jgi:1,4-alpha-glucan branching enzyme